MTEALALAEARALGGRELTVHVRLAEFGGRVYIDLADEGWRSVEVDPEGWRILERAPVRFRRAAGMLALPEPIQGGSLDELRPFMNIEDERSWRLLIGWLVMTFSPKLATCIGLAKMTVKRRGRHRGPKGDVHDRHSSP